VNAIAAQVNAIAAQLERMDLQQPVVPYPGGRFFAPTLDSVAPNTPPDGTYFIRGHDFNPNTSVTIRVSNFTGSFRQSLSAGATDGSGLLIIPNLNINYPGPVHEDLFFAATDGRPYLLDWTGQLWTGTTSVIP
jgi:hypothetical protein